jgi:hypothetical protein
MVPHFVLEQLYRAKFELEQLKRGEQPIAPREPIVQPESPSASHMPSVEVVPMDVPRGYVARGVAAKEHNHGPGNPSTRIPGDPGDPSSFASPYDSPGVDASTG